MMNNLTYNQQKTFLSQSKIIPDMKPLPIQGKMRNDKEMMYSSGIFMKSSNTSNNRPYQTYEQTNGIHSPHKYINKTPSVQFINMAAYNQNQNFQYKQQAVGDYNPVSNNLTNNLTNNLCHNLTNNTTNNLSTTLNTSVNSSSPITSILPNSCLNNISINPPLSERHSSYQKQLQQMQQKIQQLTRRVISNQGKSKNNSVTTLDDEEMFLLFNSQQDSKKPPKQKEDRTTDPQNIIMEEIQKYKQFIVEQNTKIWKKIHKFEEIFNQLNIETISKKIQQLEESFQLSNSYQIEKSSGLAIDEHVLTRIKFMQKSIRQMGDDIHLINDKEENFQLKFYTQMAQIKPKFTHISEQLKKLIIKNDKSQKNFQKNSLQITNKNSKIFNQIQNDINATKKQLKQVQKNYEHKLSSCIKQFQTRLETLYFSKSSAAQIGSCPSSQKYPYQPIVLKYLQKFKVVSSLKSNEQFQTIINQVTYYIDYQGYVLDNNRFYLVEGLSNERVRLDKKHIQLLRKNNILI